MDEWRPLITFLPTTGNIKTRVNKVLSNRIRDPQMDPWISDSFLMMCYK